MSSPESRKSDGLPQNPEENHLIEVNPTDLLRDNPAGLIANPLTYKWLQDSFGREAFDKPQVVNVLTYSPEHGQVVKMFVVDGLTRTRYVSDNPERVQQQAPGFRFQVRDVTGVYLKNRHVVKAKEYIEGQQYLTMTQYLRAVVPWTKEHKAIADDRIAAHLINGWDNMVGPEIAGRFSALAALSLLAAVPSATGDMLKKYLAKQPKLMADEKSIAEKGAIEERRLLEEKLCEISSVINESGLFSTQVARAAFILVGTRSPVIGGEKEAIRQIYSLLDTPEVQTKLREAFADEGPRAQARANLGNFLLQTSQRMARSYEQDQILTAIAGPLRDWNTTFQNIVDILSSASPTTRYHAVKAEMNRNRLFKAYTETEKRGEISEVARQLVEQTGRVTNLSEDTIQKLVPAIKITEGAVDQAINIIRTYQEQRVELMRRGVNPETIDKAIETIESCQKTLLTANSVSSLSVGRNNLQNAIAETNRSISKEITDHKFAEITEQIYSEELKTAHGPFLRATIVAYLRTVIFGQGEQTQLTPAMEVRATRELAQLHGLDQDLQVDVLRGIKRLVNAINEQNIRRQPTPSTLIQGVERKVTPTAPTTPPEPLEALSKSIGRGLEVIPDKKEAEERRIEFQNERFSRLLDNHFRPLLEALESIDLSPSEFSSRNKQLSEKGIRVLAKKVLGILDIIHQAEETAFLRKEIIKLREALLYKQEEETHKDTRTGR